MEQPDGEGTQPSTRPKACIGALFFSQSRYDKGKPPVCAGLSKRLRPPESPDPLRTDAVPGGEFKYLCLGYSAYDVEELKRSAQRRSSHSDAVQLPYCEGLEVVSAAAISRKPELLAGVGAPSAESAAAPSGERDADVRQRPGRTFVPGRNPLPPDSLPDWDQFKERFERVSRRIVEKMAVNATFMAAAAKRSVDQLLKELSGDDGSGKGRRDR